MKGLWHLLRSSKSKIHTHNYLPDSRPKLRCVPTMVHTSSEGLFSNCALTHAQVGVMFHGGAIDSMVVGGICFS
jgi:hypothetical protein